MLSRFVIGIDGHTPAPLLTPPITISVQHKVNISVNIHIAPSFHAPYDTDPKRYV